MVRAGTAVLAIAALALAAGVSGETTTSWPCFCQRRERGAGPEALLPFKVAESLHLTVALILR
jgi:hypothetical protein